MFDVASRNLYFNITNLDKLICYVIVHRTKLLVTCKIILLVSIISEFVGLCRMLPVGLHRATDPVTKIAAAYFLHFLSCAALIQIFVIFSY